MAYIVTNKEKSISFISKDLEQLSGQYPGYEIYKNGIAGHLITISDADFNLLISHQKEATVNSDLSVTLTDKVLAADEVPGFSSKEQLDSYISVIKERINHSIHQRESDNTYKNELETYKTLLENLNTSSITYPLNTSLEKYLIDQGNTILSPLQIC